MFEESQALFQTAQQYFPGGVNSPVRAFRAVRQTPIFIRSANGAYLHDVEGNEFIDYVGSWGPMICGHGHPKVIQAVNEASQMGLSFGACTKYELQLADEVKKLMPNIELLRFVNSGTEACMAAIRLARAYTQKNKIIKFTGCYHGHADSFLVEAGSGVATFGLPDSPGVLPEVAASTLTARFNELNDVKLLLETHRGAVAAVVLEAVVGNAGCILPQEGFLQGLRSLCDEHGVLLIFDEVMTGFRLSKGGAQELFGVKPDLTTLGKILGGGLPVGAFGGRADIMRLIAPEGPVYQAGTLSGNPLAMATGSATLKLLQEDGFYEKLDEYGKALQEGIYANARRRRIPVVVNRCGSMLSIFFTNQESVHNYESAKNCDLNRFSRFFTSMLEQGIYLPPSQFESWFFSSKHNEYTLNKTLQAVDRALRSLF